MTHTLYDNFIRAIHDGNILTLNHLINLASPQQISNMLEADNFGVFRWAVEDGHILMLNRLINLASPQQISNMLEADNFGVFRWAVEHGHILMLNHLINLASPQQISNMLEADNFGVFRWAVEDGHILMLNRLRELATPEQINNLNELGIISQQMFLQVQPLATHTVGQGGLGLSAVAQNSESAMETLTESEMRRLDAAIKHYQPIIKEYGGVDATLDALRETLRERYMAGNRVIQSSLGGGGVPQDTPLPFDYESFQALELSKKSREQALKAYYQNPDHTASRYLMKPNPWMDKNASFVMRDESGAWSTFDSYRELIAMLFLAAIDKDVEPIDDFTFETRLEHFIKQLGLINRAHNWDKKRINPSTGQYEEYDDLKPDRPSCSPGTKSRLFQSVLGHPLLKLLTLEIIEQEVREFVRDEFMAKINHQNCAAMLEDWQKLIDGESTAPEDLLTSLNISSEKQEAFISHLHKKYGSQFKEFDKDIRAKFKITNTIPNHAARFGVDIDLSSILERRVAETKESNSAKQGFFNSNPSDNPPSSSNLGPKK
jgi:hypothetical protein